MSANTMTREEYLAEAGKQNRKKGDTPETSLKKTCKAYLKMQGWVVLSFLQQGFVPKPLQGLPDSLIIKKGRHVWIEFKAGKGKLRPAQEVKIAELQAAGAEVLVVYRLEDLYALGDERQGVLTCPGT